MRVSGELGIICLFCKRSFDDFFGWMRTREKSVIDGFFTGKG